jgi:hypothetical protein
MMCIVLMMLAGCFVRRRTVISTGPRPSHPPLTATKEELIHRLRDISNPVDSFLMKVNMVPSVGSQFAGVITDYATIGAYVLFQRPDDLRIIGQDPVMNHTIFDMVSSGREFRIYIPSKNLFVIGDNEAPPAKSKNALENLRPKAFLTALLIDPPDPETDIVLVEDDTNETKSVYILLIVRRDGDQYRLARNVYFDRYTMQVTRQKTFDSSGNIVSEAAYSNWKNYDGISFPSDMDFKRPQENYEVQMRVISMEMNPRNVTPDRFILKQPPGSRLPASTGAK